MKQFAVIGLGRFGFSLVDALIKKDMEVLAIDLDEEKVEQVSSLATFAVQCDATDENALKAVSTQNVDTAIVSIGENIEASILIVMSLKELGIKDIIAKAVTAMHGKVLTNLGVTNIIYPERDAGIRLAKHLTSPNILEYLELFPGHSIQEIPVPTQLAGKKIKDLQIRSQFRVNIIALIVEGKDVKETSDQRGMEDFIFNPSADDVLGKNDLMLVIGKDTDIGEFSRL